MPKKNGKSPLLILFRSPLLLFSISFRSPVAPLFSPVSIFSCSSLLRFDSSIALLSLLYLCSSLPVPIPFLILYSYGLSLLSSASAPPSTPFYLRLPLLLYRLPSGFASISSTTCLSHVFIKKEMYIQDYIFKVLCLNT